MWTLGSNSGIVGLSSLVLQPADFAQAGKQLVITWLRMTGGQTLPSSPLPSAAYHQTPAAVKNSPQVWKLNVGPSWAAWGLCGLALLNAWFPVPLALCGCEACITGSVIGISNKAAGFFRSPSRVRYAFSLCHHPDLQCHRPLNVWSEGEDKQSRKVSN